MAVSLGNADRETVVVIDDDVHTRGSIDSLLRSVGIATLVFSSALEALARPWPDGAFCVIADVRMPQLGGLELQERLNASGEAIPIILITGFGDIPMSVKAMKAGAVDFLTKPFREQDLLDAVRAALTQAHAANQRRNTRSRERDTLALLTPRERDVLAGVARGLMNKQIAGELGLSEITVKLHRSSLMKKLGLRSVAELVRFNDRSQLD
ncbi:response regulator transcription factor [Novosphingobium sp. FSW06-99]|uniref:response regulator transcription factor n=1 Tax=Novosphingobium sp. FSW06-99 TaxID=1739113 RepID=UPI00076C4268|nr:response regulator [Novosphingobium sp. FSW06-99]KUR74853.1 two-component system response regulator [Novosphingobium sp. FSW06-99]